MIRVALGLVCLVGFSLFWSAMLSGVIVAAWPGPDDVDSVSRHEQRLRPLRSQLPAHGVVGYRVEAVAGQPPETAIDAGRSYFLTQYSLAPVIVVNDSQRPLVVVRSGQDYRVTEGTGP